MTDPRRLLDDDSVYPFSRGLLESASDDGLDEDHLAELVRAATKTTAGGASAEPAASSRGRLVAMKSIPLAALSLIAAGALVLSRAEEHAQPVPQFPPAIAPQSLVPSSSEPAVAPTAEAVPVAMLPSVSTAETPPRAPATGSPAVGAPARPGASADSDRLMEEVRALERVSTAIAQHRVVDARANLAAYERTFPKQLLASEARFLEIEILVAEGHHDKAQERARAYLASWPDSPYAARVRSIVTPSRP